MSELRSLDPGDLSANKTMAQAAARLGSSANPYPYGQRSAAGPDDYVQSAPGLDVPMLRREQQLQDRHGPIAQAAATVPSPNVIPFPSTPYDRAVVASGQTPSPIDGVAAQIPSPPTTDPIAAAQAAGDPLAPVMAKIGSGESGGSDPYHETYGGGHFGWQGIPNTGSGRFGFVKSTWDEASKAWMAANPGSPAPDFNKPQDQYNVGRFWAAKTYKQQTGRDLAEDARAGKVDYGALSGQWPSLGPDGGRAHREQQTQANQELREIAKETHTLWEKLNQADPHSEERWRLAREAMDSARNYERKALELAERPPSATPIDSMQKLGGLATLVGILGGLLTKTPLTASLNAGGAAMEAYKAKDDEAYKRNVDQFKFHVDALNNFANFELGIYKDIITDERAEEGEKLNRISAMAQLLGNERIAVMAQSNQTDKMYKTMFDAEKATHSLNEKIREFDAKMSQLTPYQAGQLSLGQQRLDEGKRLDNARIDNWVEGRQISRDRAEELKRVDTARIEDMVNRGVISRDRANEQKRLDDARIEDMVNRGEISRDRAEEIHRMDTARIEDMARRGEISADRLAELKRMDDARVQQIKSGGDPLGGKSDLASAARTELQIRAKALGTTYDDLARNNPDEVQKARNKAALDLSRARAEGTTGGELTDEAADLVAEQYIRGDQQAITSQPRTGPIRRQIENKIAEKMRSMDDAAGQIMMNRMRMAEARSAATTAGRVTMQTELYAREAAGAGQQVIETSKKFSRTNYPLVNQALAAYEKQTGDPDVIAFGTAIFSLLNAYGKMSNPTGTGIHDVDKERLSGVIDRYLAQGQIEAAVQQVIKEGRVVATAAEQAQHDVLATMVPGGGVVKGAVAVPPEHMSDPDGTTYTGSDNTTYVKRGGQMVPMGQ